MDDRLNARIREAVKSWVQKTYNSMEIIVGLADEDKVDDDEGERYLVDFAVRTVGYWLVAEMWVVDDEIQSVNDLGEGLPLDDTRWPWPVVNP